MRIIFLGTPEFAIPSLEKILESRHELIAVVTQLDKPSGRGNKITCSPVKEFAIKNKIPVLQYEKISRDGVEDLKKLNPDIMITAAYGQILSQAIIDIPKFGIINIHGSLLPKYRGASPIQTAILKGESETGITIMQTEAGLDTGDILSVVKTPIHDNETAGDLSKKLAILGANLLIETLHNIDIGETEPKKQYHADATITKKITKEECLINWNKSAKEIKCLIMATNPDPVSRTILNNDLVKIYRASLTDIPNTNEEPGTIVEPTSPKTGAFVQCGQGVLQIIEAQLPGGKVLQGKQLVGGRKFSVGMQFEPLVFPNQTQNDKK